MQWSEKLPELSAAGVVGPVFITVGEQEQLLKFLELNPKVPASLSFVDDTEDFEAYARTGFGSIGQGQLRGPCHHSIHLDPLSLGAA